MQQIYRVKNDNCSAESGSTVPSRAKALKSTAIQNLRVTHLEAHGPTEIKQPDNHRQTRASVHACDACQRGYLQAKDRLKRANRDLGETVAVIASSLTTVTAVEAVINIAHDNVSLPEGFPLATFVIYITVFVLILIWGTFRSSKAIRRRTRAEKDIDQAKKGIFQFCPGEQWPRADE